LHSTPKDPNIILDSGPGRELSLGLSGALAARQCPVHHHLNPQSRDCWRRIHSSSVHRGVLPGRRLRSSTRSHCRCSLAPREAVPLTFTLRGRAGDADAVHRRARSRRCAALHGNIFWASSAVAALRAGRRTPPGWRPEWRHRGRPAGAVRVQYSDSGWSGPHPSWA